MGRNRTWEHMCVWQDGVLRLCKTSVLCTSGSDVVAAFVFEFGMPFMPWSTASQPVCKLNTTYSKTCYSPKCTTQAGLLTPSLHRPAVDCPRFYYSGAAA
jgi:hypothetical protein